eukprot:6265349-Amphidinium_carterae.6
MTATLESLAEGSQGARATNAQSLSRPAQTKARNQLCVATETGVESHEQSKEPSGDRVLVGGDRFVRVSKELAASFRSGDALLSVESTGEVLHLPAAEKKATLIDSLLGSG